MGATQSIPIVGEVVTIVDSAARTVAAGGCALVGQTGAAQKLINSAGQSWVDYSEKSAIVSNIQVLANLDNPERRDYLLQKQGEAWKSLGENTPVIGHGVGAYYYLSGDTDAGDRCMIGATRTAVIATAAVATGGGALVAGGVSVVAAAAYDGVATGIHSARYWEYRPVGYIDAVTTAIKSGDACDIYVVISNPVTDFATGAMIKRIATAPAARAGGAPGLLRDGPGIARPAIGVFEPKPEVPGGRLQLGYNTVYNSGFMRTAATTSQFRTMLQVAANGQAKAYDFVRRPNGEYRFISHEDAQTLRDLHRTPVGHTSLVGPNQLVVAAGEIYVNENATTININSLSGHYQFPLNQLINAMGPTWPLELFDNAARPRIAFGIMVVRQIAPPMRVRPITRYTCIITKSILISVGAARYVVAVYNDDHVETTLFEDENLARQVYDHATQYPSRILGQVSNGNLTSCLEKTGGHDTDNVISHLTNTDRAEPADYSGLSAPQFLEILEDNQDLYGLVCKKENQKFPLYLGRVTVASNERQITIPCEIKLGQDPNLAAYWDGKAVQKQHLVGNAELLTNERNMHWVPIQDIKSERCKDMPVEIGYDGTSQSSVYAVCEQKKQQDELKPLLGYWVNGNAQACLIANVAKNVDDFNVLCWNPRV